MIAKWKHDSDSQEFTDTTTLRRDKNNNPHYNLIENPLKREVATSRELIMELIWKVDSRVGGYCEVATDAGEVMHAHPNSRADMHGIKRL